LSEWWIFLKPRYDVWFPIFNFLSIHSKCFKGNENEENFWFDDLSDASMEEAVTAETHDETFREDVRKTMEEKKRSQGDTRRPREIQAIPWKIQEGR
jgi:hypothetical protein